MSKTRTRSTLSIKPDIFSLLASQIVDYGTVVSKNGSKLLDTRITRNIFGKFPKEKLALLTRRLITYIRSHAKLSITLATITILAIFFGTKILNKNPLTQNLGVSSQTDFSPAKQTAIGKRLEIPIRTAKGVETADKLIITSTTVDRANRILIQGKPATARDTKAFLIINLEIENSTVNQLTVRPVDFIRLQDDAGRNFAPDVHNDDVTVEPVSIKKTRVGFVVDESQNTFKFLFGELNGTKEVVEVNI